MQHIFAYERRIHRTERNALHVSVIIHISVRKPMSRELLLSELRRKLDPLNKNINAWRYPRPSLKFN